MPTIFLSHVGQPRIEVAQGGYFRCKIKLLPASKKTPGKAKKNGFKRCLFLLLIIYGYYYRRLIRAK
jgi:hypothetical protein